MKTHSKSILIDGEKIEIPVSIFNESKRKTILITAGVDGDEYAGIKAAYKLISNFSKLKTNFRLIVIPLVNVFGNNEGVSYNPRDGKFPKYIYPGNKEGSSSEQLIYHLDEFIKECFLWIDLHSGSSDEKLEPFIWTWQTKSKKVNDQTLSLISDFQEDEIIYQKDSTRKVDELAKKEISYIMLESGELGEEGEVAIEKHLDWIKKIVVYKPKINSSQAYRKVKFYRANKSGMWRPKLSPGKIDREEDVGFINQKFVNSRKGLILYIKKPMLVKKGEEIFATAYDREII